MSFSPFSRFRNFTLDNFKAFLEIYPDISTSLHWKEAANEIEIKLHGYKKTAYQQTCQLGIEDRGSKEYHIHSYLYTFDDEYLLKYLEFWMKTYYAPNPFVDSNDEPFLIYCEFIKELLQNAELKINYNDFFSRRIGGGSSDILLNALKSFCSPLKYINKEKNHIFYIEEEFKEYLNNEVEFIEREFAIVNAKDKTTFFNRYSYANFCKFHKINGFEINNRSRGGDNVIYYGIPGCGKSYHIQHNIIEENHIPKENVIRTTFYQDYTNPDFIGQLLPSVDGERVTYIPVPGPFTKALKRAYETNDMVYLIIEEINRGNAAAIFGDAFQLLDRHQKDEGEFKKGDSLYPISNNFIENYLIDYCGITAFYRGQIYIPSNLTILATMNTSDQNVFPLDTAFKRRWKMKRIKNEIDAQDISNLYIPNTNKMTWGKFLKNINKQIASSDDIYNAEDKQIGVFFINKEMLVEDTVDTISELTDDFCETVLRYIWDDIAKYERERWFKKDAENQLPASFDDVMEIIHEEKDILAPFVDNIRQYDQADPVSTKDNEED